MPSKPAARLPHRLSRLDLLFWLTAAVLLFTVPPGHAAEGFSAGLTVQPMASAEDIGLPVYPGAKPYRERDDDDAGAHLNIWGGSFGMRLQALKLRTPDSVDAVATYYRDALARYGRVLDCGNEPEPAPADKQALRCEQERPTPGTRLFKVGTKKLFRLVAIEPAKDSARGGATQIQLLRMEFKRD